MTAPTVPATPEAARMRRIRRLWTSSVGQKAVMALCGLGGAAFVLVHMAGNLQMFKPAGAAQAMHQYAVNLRALGPLLWVARIGLLVLVVGHVVAALLVTLRNRAARPLAYDKHVRQAPTAGARAMRVGGVVLLAFIVFHLADLTWGLGHPGFVHLDPYNNMRVGFQRWWVVAFYVVAVVALALHLYHGLWAAMRTLGLRQPSGTPFRRTTTVAIAVLVGVGMAAVPLAAGLGAFPEDAPIMTHQRATAPPGVLPPGSGK